MMDRLTMISTKVEMLHEWKKDGKGKQVGFTSRCPSCSSHEKGQYPLTVSMDKKRVISLHCSLGCSQETILKAMRFSKKVLFPLKRVRRRVLSSLTALVSRPENIPDTVEGLQEFILIEGARLEAYRAALKKVNRLNIAQDVWMKTLKDAQGVARALLYAEVKLGDLLKAIPNKEASSARGTRSLPEGITKKQSHEAQLFSDHADIVELTIGEAEHHQDIASRRGVLRNIERAGKSEEKRDRSEVNDVEAGSLKDAKKRLVKCLALLQEPFPTDLNSDDFEVLRELARCIARRLMALFPELTSPSGKTEETGTEIVLEKNGSGCYEANVGA